MKDFQDIRVGVEDGVMTVTMHRPDKLNAMSRTMLDEIIEAIRAEETPVLDDPKYKAVSRVT